MRADATLSTFDLMAFGDLRDRVFAGIERAFAEGASGKGFEGAMLLELPTPHGIDEPRWAIELHLYVFGPNRHYRWEGPTLAAVVEQARAEVEAWLRDEPTDADSPAAALYSKRHGPSGRRKS